MKIKFFDVAISFSKRVARLFSANPVFVFGLSLAPVVVASTTLKNGVAFSLAAFIIIVPTLFIISLIGKKMNFYLRMALYSLIACVFYIPAIYFITWIVPDSVDKLGVYLPLMVVNTIIIGRGEFYSVIAKPHKALLDAFYTVLGMALVICVLSTIREIIGNATIWNINLGYNSVAKGILLPFSGFILVGLGSALLKFIKIKNKRWIYEKNEKEKEEI